MSDHESYYHDIWQSISYNETHWVQLFYFNGVEVSPMLVWDDSKGLNFEDQDLSNDLFTR